MKNEALEAEKWQTARKYQRFAERQGLSIQTQKSIPDLVNLSKEDKKIFIAALKIKTDDIPKR